MALFYLPYNFGTVETQLIFFVKVERGTAFDMKRDRNWWVHVGSKQCRHKSINFGL